MPINPRAELQQVWDKFNKGKTELVGTPFNFDLESKMAHFVQVGDSYYFVSHIPTLRFDYLSPQVTTILGYPFDSLSMQFLLGLIHPEDLPYFFAFEESVGEFFNRLPAAKFKQYKTRYDYRVKKADGTYIRVLQQVITIEHGGDGSIIRTLGIHTDITHLKPNGKPMLSIIGLEGEPSYIDIKVKSKFIEAPDVLRKREKEILLLLISGLTTPEIASQLHISKLTVETHRKNMLSRLKLKSTPQLVSKAIQEGWV